MKVYLLKNVEKVGIAGEIVKVKEGFASNFLIPHKLAVAVTPANEGHYLQRVKVVENRKEVIESKTSMLAERIKSLKLSIRRKMHDNGQLYGAINSLEIVDLLGTQGISVSKSQIVFDKSIKSKGNFDIIIKLSSKLQPKMQLTVLPE